MTTWGTTFKLGLSAVFLFACFATGVQDNVLGEGKGAVGGKRATRVQLQGTVVCVGCLLNEVQEEQPAQAKTFTQLSQGQEQLVLQVQGITAPPEKRAVAWPPPQLEVRSPGQLAEKLNAAAQPGKAVTIRGLLHPDQSLEVIDVAAIG